MKQSLKAETPVIGGSLPQIECPTQLGGTLSFAQQQISKSVKKGNIKMEHQNETNAPNAAHQVIYIVRAPKEKKVHSKDAATALGVIQVKKW